MKWQQVREQFPDQWLLFADVDSYITDDKRRIIRELAPIQAYDGFYDALAHHHKLHKKNPQQRYYVYHTSNDEIHIKLQLAPSVRRYR